MSNLFKRHVVVCFLSQKQKNELFKEFGFMIVLEGETQVWVSLQKATSAFWQWISEEKISFCPVQNYTHREEEALAAFNTYKTVEKESESVECAPAKKKKKYVNPTSEEIEFVNSFFNIDVLALRKKKNDTYVQVKCPFVHLHKSNDAHPSASLHLSSLNIKCFAHTSKFKYYNRFEWIEFVKKQ